MLLNSDDRVFVAQRLDRSRSAWQMPQGGIEDGETPRQAALRELEEEIGTNKAEILAESAQWLSYDLPPELVPKLWRGRYRGQRQKWFALRFLGRDRDIDLATEQPEFSVWKWAAPGELAGLIVPGHRFLRPRIERMIEDGATINGR